MNRHSELQLRFPRLADALPHLALTSLPTPVRVASTARFGDILIKDDSHSASLYGGNKVRKLEYLLAPAIAKQRDTVATFGAAGSHHALATALYAKRLNLHTIAFLSHQTRVDGIAETLRLHQALGTQLVLFGGSYAARIATLRRHLRSRRAMIIPMGGSSWRGNVAFIDAALELAGQIAAGDCPQPDRLYVATGTMGTTVGLALGLALCGLSTEIHAVRVSPLEISNEHQLQRLAAKTVGMLHRLDHSFPADLARRIKVKFRHDCFGSGYAHSSAATERAIRFAKDELDLPLETTYTAKAMAALLADLENSGNRDATPMFWQTYHAAPMPDLTNEEYEESALPTDFLRYFS